MSDEKRNILVVGGGGREATLVWKLNDCPRIGKIYCAPGLGGNIIPAENVDIAVEDFDGLAKLAVDNEVGLTVVGPEVPLVKGIVDHWENEGLVEKGYRIFGPNAAAAELEGSKVFSKQFMGEEEIPTARSRMFNNYDAAVGYVQATGAPIVVKADGLAAGKGAIVCQTLEEATDALKKVMVDKEFGDAGDRVIIEEFMTGEEASILALTDGKTILTLMSSQDHKPVYDGDKGDNTGGMGAYAPAPIVTESVSQLVMDQILRPTVDGMARRGAPYKGCLYAGLMIKDGQPRVVEFNCRFGDPETQPVLTMLENAPGNDLATLLYACTNGTLDQHEVVNKEGAAVCVVMASGGYPGSYKKDKMIWGVSAANMKEGVQVFPAGVKVEGTNPPVTYTNGGRVLGVTAQGVDIAQAIERAYAPIKAGNIGFKHAHFRNDIGAKALR